MNEPNQELVAAAHRAANRLHHLSMRYAGAVVELAEGKRGGAVPDGYPGLHEARDLIDLVLLTRAEINALTKLLLDAGVFSANDCAKQQAEEYEWLAQVKAKQFGCTVTDYGLSFPGRHTQQ